jgi:hypothetical protein
MGIGGESIRSTTAWIFIIIGLVVAAISAYGFYVGTAALYNVFIGIAFVIIGVILAYLKIG